MRVELRATVRRTTQYGTGEADNQPDWYVDARALFGKDFDYESYVLKPYLGWVIAICLVIHEARAALV